MSSRILIDEVLITLLISGRKPVKFKLSGVWNRFDRHYWVFQTGEFTMLPYVGSVWISHKTILDNLHFYSWYLLFINTHRGGGNCTDDNDISQFNLFLIYLARRLSCNLYNNAGFLIGRIRSLRCGVSGRSLFPAFFLFMVRRDPRAEKRSRC